MEQTNGNDSAFPIESIDDTGEISNLKGGLTKREYFAAMAMQGYMANMHTQHQDPHNIADYSVKCAHTLVQYLNQYAK